MILWFGKKKKKKLEDAAEQAALDAATARDPETEALKAQLEDAAMFQEATGHEDRAEAIEEEIEKIEEEGVEAFSAPIQAAPPEPEPEP
ncbi:MAG TPA: hypothetical protein DDZ43_03390, partial [Hyphomonadaceae bacterium]|nr:hypothetical protein [Hyphomonadaceae bacterium]